MFFIRTFHFNILQCQKKWNVPVQTMDTNYFYKLLEGIYTKKFSYYFFQEEGIPPDPRLCAPRWKRTNGGGGPRVVVNTAAFHARARGSVPGLGGLKETNNVFSPSTCESQYCGEPPWPRGSVLGLRPPGLEFRILCLEDSVISIISPSSRGSPGPV